MKGNGVTIMLAPGGVISEDRKLLETLGCKFGPETNVGMELMPPVGWRFSKGDRIFGKCDRILDSWGRKRVALFAQPSCTKLTVLAVTPRYQLDTSAAYSEGRGRMIAFARDNATGDWLYQTQPYTVLLGRGNLATCEVTDQLDRNLPRWEDPLAYWDE